MGNVTVRVCDGNPAHLPEGKQWLNPGPYDRVLYGERCSFSELLSAMNNHVWVCAAKQDSESAYMDGEKEDAHTEALSAL